MLKDYIAYYKDNPKGYWFKAKLYGWGWTPVTWQGWFVIVGYILAIILAALVVNQSPPTSEASLVVFLVVVLLTTALICICCAKGEPPRWQWGPPKSKK